MTTNYRVNYLIMQNIVAKVTIIAAAFVIDIDGVCVETRVRSSADTAASHEAAAGDTTLYTTHTTTHNITHNTTHNT